jgi:hypothetical protein
MPRFSKSVYTDNTIILYFLCLTTKILLYYYCRNFPNGQPDFPNMLILKRLGGVNPPPPQYPLATALIAYEIEFACYLPCSGQARTRVASELTVYLILAKQAKILVNFWLVFELMRVHECSSELADSQILMRVNWSWA